MSSSHNHDGDTGGRLTGGRPPGAPRWVKVAGIIVVALVLLFAVMKLTGIGRDHGPGRHMHGGVPNGQTALQEGGALSPDGRALSGGHAVQRSSRGS